MNNGMTAYKDTWLMLVMINLNTSIKSGMKYIAEEEKNILINAVQIADSIIEALDKRFLPQESGEGDTSGDGAPPPPKSLAEKIDAVTKVENAMNTLQDKLILNIEKYIPATTQGKQALSESKPQASTSRPSIKR